MGLIHCSGRLLTTTLAVTILVAGRGDVFVKAAGYEAPVTLRSARVSLAGTSNIHAFEASTTAVRLTNLRISATASAGGTLLKQLTQPGVLEAFDIAIPAATLSSPKEGLDKNMHKALRVQEHPDITFRLTRLEAREAATDVVPLRAIGMLQVAGVEREVALDIKAQHTGSGLSISGEVPIVMTDFNVKPPKAMLGMLRTDPKVTIRFEVQLGVPLT